MDNDWLGWFLVGVFAGLIMFLALYILFDPIRVDSVQGFEEPNEVYEITVDDLMFHCTGKPILRPSKIRLIGCSETYGRALVIQSYDSYSLRTVSSVR